MNMYGEMIRKFSTVQPRIVCSLEGGYNLECLPKGVASELGVLCNMPVIFKDNVAGRECNDVVKKLKDVMKEYWEL